MSRSLRRTLRSGRFGISTDQAFDAVVAACAERPGEGTWIIPAMRTAYGRLHRRGYAHSIEVWESGRLVGGLYGVAVGGAFMGESMFHLVTDASKVALVRLGELMHATGFVLFDAQLPTPHLCAMGAQEMRRDDYLDALAAAVRLDLAFPVVGR